MVTPFNTQDDLKDRLSFIGPNANQWNLEDRLLDATLELETDIGRDITEALYPDYEDQTDFSLHFSNIHEVIDVVVVSPSGTFDQLVDSSNYTVTKEPSRSNPVNISFDQTWAEDNLFSVDFELRVRYVPDLFRRYELKLAKWDVAVDYATQTGDDETTAKVEKIKERTMKLRKSINSSTANLNVPDPGENLAANYNFPGNR